MKRTFKWRPFTHWCAYLQLNPAAWPKGQRIQVLDRSAEVHLNGDGWQVRWSWCLGIDGSGGDLSQGIAVKRRTMKRIDRNPWRAEAFEMARRKCERAIAENILSDESLQRFAYGFIACDRSGNARDRRRKRRSAVRDAIRWARKVLAELGHPLGISPGGGPLDERK